MIMRGSANQLVTCILTLVTFTGATLTKLEKEKKIKEIDDTIERKTGRKPLSGNDTYKKFDHYYYTQENIVDGTVGKDVVEKFQTGLPESRELPSNITPNFNLKIYGNEYNKIIVNADGYVKMKSSEKSITDVSINALVYGTPNGYMSLLNTAKVILVMYSDGRLVIIYEEIPTEIDSEYLISQMQLSGRLGSHNQLYNSINVPNSMIKTGVVVQLTPTEKYCSKETSEQACRDASTPDVVCYWCDGSSVCTSTFDHYTQIWFENDCNIAVMGEDNKGDSLSSNSNLNPTETASTSSETSNQQLEATTKMSSTTSPLSVQKENSSILIIIIVPVICLLVLLIVLAIWYLTRKKLDY